MTPFGDLALFRVDRPVLPDIELTVQLDQNGELVNVTPGYAGQMIPVDSTWNEWGGFFEDASFPYTGGGQLSGLSQTITSWEPSGDWLGSSVSIIPVPEPSFLGLLACVCFLFRRRQ